MMIENNTIVVLISGTGSNLAYLLKLQQLYNYKISAVISNNPQAKGIEKAVAAKVDHYIINHKDYSSRDEFDAAIAKVISVYNPILIVLAGFMRILGSKFIDKFANKIINLHPSLLPNYKGCDTYKRVLADNQRQHGCTVHFVTAELDCGSSIAQVQVSIAPNDNEQSLRNKVQSVEYVVYPWVVYMLISGRIQLIDDKVFLDKKRLSKSGCVFTEKTLEDKIKSYLK